MNKRNCMNRVSTLSLRSVALRGKNNMQQKNYQGMNTHWWSQLWSQQSNIICVGEGATVASSKNAAFLLLIICKHELFPCNTHHHRRQMVNYLHTYYYTIIISFRFYFLLLVYYLLSHELSLRGAQVDSTLWWLVSVIISYIYFAHVRQLRSSSWDDLLLDGRLNVWLTIRFLFFILLAKNKLHKFTLFLKWFILLPIIACSCTNKIIIFFSFL